MTWLVGGGRSPESRAKEFESTPKMLLDPLPHNQHGVTLEDWVVHRLCEPNKGDTFAGRAQVTRGPTRTPMITRPRPGRTLAPDGMAPILRICRKFRKPFQSVPRNTCRRAG